MFIKSFCFSPFAENTYIIYDETKECAIVDPGCYEKHEKDTLVQFIQKENLKPVLLLNTHGHIDHIFGNYFVHQTYGLLPQIHEDDLFLLQRLTQIASLYNIPNVDESPLPEKFLKEGDTITFGNTSLDIIFVPGHSPGHIAFIHQNDKTILSGDVLFQNSIGRTDLPGGNYDTLISSIKTKLFSLPDDFTVYSGHGPTTTIGYEKRTNPFLT
jgi:hydroxyacylglutathione hydrolase